MSLPRYATREALKAAANISGTAEDAALDRHLAASTSAAERMLGRHFFPKIETRFYDWPSRSQGALYLVLDGDLRSVTTLQTEAQDSSPVTVPPTDYFLSPANLGPPYPRIEIDLSSSSSLAAGDTSQRSISVAGVWGFSADEEAAGATAEALDDSETGVDVTDSSKVGIGDLIKVDSERMVVTDKSLLSTGTTLGSNIDALERTVTVPVADGAAVKKGEVITIDAERMLVEDIAGNNLIVKRAFDGSVLAAHSSGATVYAPRTLTVVRAAAGTTAAAHNTAAAIARNVPPGLITELVIAEAITAREQEKSGYGREIGQGEGASELRGVGLLQLRKRVMTLYERRRRGAV